MKSTAVWALAWSRWRWRSKKWAAPCCLGRIFPRTLAGVAIDAAGNPAQKRKYLSRISMGEARATLALLEADARWDPGAV
jgi:alkylation response protein AidB-like acyl-CoA dehydrogenase